MSSTKEHTKFTADDVAFFIACALDYATDEFDRLKSVQNMTRAEILDRLLWLFVKERFEWLESFFGGDKLEIQWYLEKNPCLGKTLTWDDMKDGIKRLNSHLRILAVIPRLIDRVLIWEDFFNKSDALKRGDEEIVVEEMM